MGASSTAFDSRLPKGNDMNRFGEIADELTDLIEEMEGPELAQEGRALKAALERAFVRACEAERALRRRIDAAPTPAKIPRRRLAAAELPRTGVVIELPLAWRLGAAAARRLGD
jgi:hypothetical protein